MKRDNPVMWCFTAVQSERNTSGCSLFFSLTSKLQSKISTLCLGGLLYLSIGISFVSYSQQEIPVIRNQRELFVDNDLIDDLTNVELRLQTPISGGKALIFDKPWEAEYALGGTVVKDDTCYRLFYRGYPAVKNHDSGEPNYLCYAESKDGITWNRPDLRQVTVYGTLENNVLKDGNMTVLYDDREEVPPRERYKALVGGGETGLYVVTSPDGFSWTRVSSDTTLVGAAKGYSLDSPNVLTWVPSEQTYAIYMRGWTEEIPGKARYKGIRTILRSTSRDLIHWSEPEMMDFGNTPMEHLYTNATQPYFRAPHLLIAIPMRFQPDSTSNLLSKEELLENGIQEPMWTGVSDAVLMTSRGGNKYDRSFMESFVRPGLDKRNWAARSQIVALGVVPTGDTEMSFYVTRAYGSKPYLERMVLRMDGFTSLHAGYEAGAMTTKLLTADGDLFFANYSTSPTGYIKVAILDENGEEIEGLGEQDAFPLRGDKIDGLVSWKSGQGIAQLRGRKIRIKFILKDADLYSFGIFDEMGRDKID